MPFYPFSEYAIGLNLVKLLPLMWQDTFLPILDAVLLLFWIFWMQFKLKVDNYF